jgi:hypothetical protein
MALRPGFSVPGRGLEYGEPLGGGFLISSPSARWVGRDEVVMAILRRGKCRVRGNPSFQSTVVMMLLANTVVAGGCPGRLTYDLCEGRAVTTPTTQILLDRGTNRKSMHEFYSTIEYSKRAEPQNCNNKLTPDIFANNESEVLAKMK